MRVLKITAAAAALASLLSAPVFADDKTTFSKTVDDTYGKGTVTGEIQTKVVSTRDDYLTTKRMNIKRTGAKGEVIWTVRDFVEECPVDTELDLVAPIEITDLNDDGAAEIWMVYKLACRGDVSPSVMKIIMYEGKKKHAVRGSMLIDLPSESIIEGGDYKMDSNMEKADPAVREHAEFIWNRYKKEF